MDTLIVFLVVFFGFAILLRVPVAYSLGIGTLAGYLYSGLPILSFSQASFSSLDSIPFLAVPFFILAGTVMEYSGISGLILNFAKSLIGKRRGAIGTITIIASTLFGVLTGSVLATASAIGKMVIPEMRKSGYENSYAAALVAATAFLGVLIPPSIPGIILALSASLPVTTVWLSTVGPGLVLAAAYIIINYYVRKNTEPKTTEHGSIPMYLKNISTSFTRSIPALLMPVIIFGGIYGGIFTPTEAGAVSALYGIAYYLIKKAVKKDGVESNLISMTIESAVSTGTIAMLMIFASGATRLITMVGVGNKLSQLITGFTASPQIFLLMVNVLFLIMGTFLDINSSIMIMTPLLMPTVYALGIDPIHFSAITLLNLCIGNMTPPFAASIFLSAKIAEADFLDVCKKCVPYLLAALVVLAIVTYVPEITLLIPNMLK